MATKEERLFVRLKPDIKQKFKKLAKDLETTPSEIIHDFILKTLRDAGIEVDKYSSTLLKEDQNVETKKMKLPPDKDHADEGERKAG